MMKRKRCQAVKKCRRKGNNSSRMSLSRLQLRISSRKKCKVLERHYLSATSLIRTCTFFSLDLKKKIQSIRATLPLGNVAPDLYFFSRSNRKKFQSFRATLPRGNVAPTPFALSQAPRTNRRSKAYSQRIAAENCSNDHNTPIFN